jgi:hypothetical protein
MRIITPTRIRNALHAFSVLALLLLLSGCGPATAPAQVELWPVLCHAELTSPYSILLYLRIGNRSTNDASASTTAISYMSGKKKIKLSLDTPPVPARGEIILTIAPPPIAGKSSQDINNEELPSGQMLITLDAQHVLLDKARAETVYHTACTSNARWYDSNPNW